MGEQSKKPISLKKVALIGFCIGYFGPAMLYVYDTQIAPEAQASSEDPIFSFSNISFTTKQGKLCKMTEYGVNSGKMTVLSYEGMDISLSDEKRTRQNEINRRISQKP